MKSVFLVMVVTMVVVVKSQGVPTKKCPSGEHSVLYCPQKAEPTCDNPTVHQKNPPSGLCGVPQCFCDTPTIRNTKTGKCVSPSDCK